MTSSEDSLTDWDWTSKLRTVGPGTLAGGEASQTHMQILPSNSFEGDSERFEVLADTMQCQVAVMTLGPGETSGEYGNEHAGSVQVMYVIAGEAEATVEGKELVLKTGDTIVIETGEQHQIRCKGNALLRTINFYSPPAYEGPTQFVS